MIFFKNKPSLEYIKGSMLTSFSDNTYDYYEMIGDNGSKMTILYIGFFLTKYKYIK